MLQSGIGKIQSECCLVLASGSPRRRDILSKTLPELTFHIVPALGDEPRPELDDRLKKEPWLYPEKAASFKAEEVFHRLLKDDSFKGRKEGKDLVVIGADTVVYHDQFLLKPRCKDEARRTLERLRNDTHQVYTGVAIFSQRLPLPALFSVKTDVTFDDISTEDIEAYIATEEPLDKAGAYGIQARGSSFVTEIKGDYFNVEGFPVHAFCRTLKRLFL